jgi:hypothetical protein
MRKHLKHLTAALLAAGLAGTAGATALPYKDITQLAREADGIVIGTVRGLQTVVSTPGEIHTYVSIEPQEVLSGQLAQRQLTLKLLGGFDGQRGLHIVGAPQFQAGERVLLFVQGNGQDLVPFVGWNQGVFRITRDEDGTDRVLDADGQRVVGVQGRHLLRDVHAGSESRPHAHLLGAPPITLMRELATEADAGSTDDGSAIEQQRAAAAPLAALPTLPLARLLDEVRRHAGAGRTLASADAASHRLQASTAAETSSQPPGAAAQAVARPAEGAVAEPVARPATPAPSRQR